MVDDLQDVVQAIRVGRAGIVAKAAVAGDGRPRGRGGVAPAAAAVAVLVMLAGLAPLPAIDDVQSAASTTAGQAFDVASIRRNTSGPPGPAGNMEVVGVTPDGFQTRNATLLSVIRYVYGVPPFRDDLVAGGPDWVSKDRFDIDAKAGRRVSREEALPMTMRLLEERFRLVVRSEPQERDVMALSLARSDGRLGPELRPAAADCTPPTLESRLAARKAGTAPPPNTTTCGTIAGLVERLERDLQTTVIDKTGLTGRWDYSLTYLAERSLVPPFPGLEPLPQELRPPSDTPSPATALREQLGLALTRQRGTVDVFAIKSVEPPTAN